jgi:hypothetical protein
MWFVCWETYTDSLGWVEKSLEFASEEAARDFSNSKPGSWVECLDPEAFYYTR